MRENLKFWTSRILRHIEIYKRRSNCKLRPSDLYYISLRLSPVQKHSEKKYVIKG